jgi:SET domain-containing protein
MTLLANADEPEAAVKAIAFPRCPHLGIVNVPGKGRGVVATALIPAGTLLESAPVIRITRDETKILKNTILDKYVFDWEDEEEDNQNSLYDRAVVLGAMSLFNHSGNPNSYIEIDFHNQIIKMITDRDIYPEEEITYDYNCPLWFEVKE